MADPRLQQLGQQYGGNFGGSGVANAPSIGTINRGIYFDPATNQHYTLQNGQPKYLQNTAHPSQNIFQKIGAVASQSFNIGETIAKAGARFVVNTPKYIYQGSEGFLRPVAEVITRSPQAELGNIRDMQSTLDQSLQQYHDMYKSGKLSKDAYTKALLDLSKGYDDLSNDAQDIQRRAQKEGDARSVILSAAETAATILSVGRYKPIEATGAKAIGEGFTLLNAPPAKVGLEGALNAAASKVENALQTIPSFRELVTRNLGKINTQNAQQIAGETTAQFLSRNSKDLAIGLLIKRPIVYQTNIGLGDDIYKDIIKGNYNQALKDSAWIGALAIGGGPLGWFFRQGGKLTSKLGELASGKSSFIDEISKRIGNGSPTQIADYLSGLKGKQFADTEKTLRIAQEVNLQTADNNAVKAADYVLNHYQQHNIALEYLTPKQLVEDLGKWSQADEIARTLSPKDQPTEYVAVRWDTATKNAVANQVRQAGDDVQAITQALDELASQPGVGWSNNRILMAKIVNAIRGSATADEAAQKIKDIPTASTLAKDIPERYAKKLAKLGYSVAEPFGGRKTPKVDYQDTRKLVSSITHGSDVFDEATAPHPVMDSLMTPLRKFGLTPESNTKVAYDKLSDTLVTNLEELHATTDLGLVGEDTQQGAKFILSRLQNYVDKQAPNPYLNVLVAGRSEQSALQDIRQMNIKEIMEALPGTSRDTAKALQKSILKAYTDVPLEFRGLGIKAYDYAYRFPGAKIYSRIQSALRYTYNPFFRTQEVIETKMLSHLKANNLVWMKTRQKLDDVSQLLDDSKIFTTGYTGEATQDLTIGRIHANLLKTQKRDLAGLALDIAEKRGISIDQMVADHPDELADALRVIVQYPTKGALNSPLARTLNIAFFPMRYNLKVASIVAKEVAKLPPTLQLPFIHSMFQFSGWLKSPEGIQWQSDNADVLQIFSYLTVENNITGVLNLLHGKPTSVSDVGLLGGLPFGFISQILEAEGIIHTNTPYVDPRTGSVLPDYIPQTSKARAAVALEGLLNTMFTYPGRIMGLPGKGQTIRNLVDMFLKTGGNEYLQHVNKQGLTPLQQKMIQVLSDPNVSQKQIDELFTSPADSEFNWYTLPPSTLPSPVPVLTRQQVAAQKAAAKGSSKSKKGKKKALPIPARGQQLQL